MGDFRALNPFLEPTRTHIQKALDKLPTAIGRCYPHDPTPAAFVEVDDLRYACLALERALDMLNRANRLLKAFTEAEQ